MKAELALAAEDAEDLEVISARLQDAVAQVKDLVWLPRSRRFAALFNRFKWEDAEHDKRAALRVRSGLRFEGVRAVKSAKIARGDRDAVLSLLAVTYTRNGADDPAGWVELVFSGGGTIKLDVEYLDAELSDVSGPWAARGRPAHEAET
jgi:hypothetical protein